MDSKDCTVKLNQISVINKENILKLNEKQVAIVRIDDEEYYNKPCIN